jgi:T4 RnlA family RNA ligase
LKLPHKSHKELYLALVSLIKEQLGIFVSKTHLFDEKYYRVFTYTHASYSHYSLDEASFEARGITFEVCPKGDFISLVSLPMQKFFNYKENPYTQGIEHLLVKHAMVKEDGSLVSSYLHNGEVKLKSKSTPISDYAYLFNDYIDANEELRNIILGYENKGFTVNLEYTAPDNQIVLAYKKTSMTILNVRNRATGDYIPYEELKKDVEKYLVKDHPEFHGLTIEEFSQLVHPMEGIEGFVVQLEDGKWVKLKTHWYCLRHNAVDKLSPYTRKGRREIIFAALDERIDDIKQTVEDNPFMVSVLDMVEEFLSDFINETEVLSQEFINKYQNETDQKEVFVAAKSFFSCNIQKTYGLNALRGIKNDFNKGLFHAANSSKFEKYNELMDTLKEKIE